MNISRLMCSRSLPNSQVGNIVAWMGANSSVPVAWTEVPT